MEIIIILSIVQGIIGAFDLFYHHEYLERLPWRKTASTELKLHGIRNFFYAVVFASFGWLAWHGAYAWVFMAILAIEVLITLWDFVEEDLSRALPATERVSHTLLALNYGAILALFVPLWLEWQAQPDGFATHYYGWLSWVMAVFAAGVFLWGIRDLTSGIKLSHAKERAMKHTPELQGARQRILVAGGSGFVGAPLCQLLIAQGHDVTIITRDIERAAAKFDQRVAFVQSADALHKDDIFDAVINLTGEPIAQRWSQAVKARIVESRLESIASLARYLARAVSKPHVYVQASAIGVYGLDANATFTEETTPRSTPESFSESVCLQLEDATDRIAKMGIRTCLLRIGLVLEKDGGILSQLLFPFEFGLGGKVGDGEQWMSWIHRDDVIGLIYHAVNNDGVEGALNVTAPEPVPQKIFAKTMGRIMRRPTWLRMPACQVKLMFGAMGKELLLGGQKVLPKRAMDSGYKFAYPELETALQAILKQRHG